jgi:hypothetical protein
MKKPSRRKYRHRAGEIVFVAMAAASFVVTRKLYSARAQVSRKLSIGGYDASQVRYGAC